jgi:hypothetical protein
MTASAITVITCSMIAMWLLAGVCIYHEIVMSLGQALGSVVAAGLFGATIGWIVATGAGAIAERRRLPR